MHTQMDSATCAKLHELLHGVMSGTISHDQFASHFDASVGHDSLMKAMHTLHAAHQAGHQAVKAKQEFTVKGDTAWLGNIAFTVHRKK